MIVCNGSVERRLWRARLAAVASAAVILLISAPSAAQADTCHWTGAGADNLWSTPANWTCSGSHLVPENNDALVFPTTGLQFASANDLSGLSLGSISIDDQRYELSGNGIELTQHLTAVLPAAGTPTVALPLMLSSSATQIVVSGIAGAELRVTGPISGGPNAHVVKNGAGVLTLFNPANVWGEANVADGTLRLGRPGGASGRGAVRSARNARAERA